MKLKQYQVDAFTDKVFEGNPAAVCPLDKWLDDDTLQAIAEENNLSETAFTVPSTQGFQLRWFTPVTEVDLCGHATLAASHVFFEILRYPHPIITFETKSGDLIVEKQGPLYVMDFPAHPPTPCPVPNTLVAGLGKRPIEVLFADDYIAVFESEQDIKSIKPDYEKLKQLNLRGVAATAPGRESDFVSRFFAPKFGIPEDPVTGSAHCELAPYWQSKFIKKKLTARQLSKRGGRMVCEIKGSRVSLSGQAITFMEAEISF